MSAATEIDMLDVVKHKLNETTGTVIAMYSIGGIAYLDVRGDYRIYYETPKENWTVVSKRNE